jgi:RNA polymerase sigma-70 factor (ECF subfamily)
MMSEANAFAELVRRLRAGDSQAASELVRQYEPAIRLEVRCRLTDRRLRRVFDSMDVCQAVLGSFFVRAAAGEYDLDRPEQLLGLLKEMARRKLAHEARQQRAQRRDVRRAEGLDGEGRQAAALDPTPSRVVAGQDLLDEVRRRLSPEERRLAELRGQGRQWADIATELGGTAQARRKQLARALDRIAEELGLDVVEA